MHQIRQDIRAAIIGLFEHLKRPATVPEISAGVWFACSVDGTRSEIHSAVVAGCLFMVGDGSLEVVRVEGGRIYVHPDLLTRMALIR